MTMMIVFTCNGNRPHGAPDRCRAFLPVPVDYVPVSQLVDPDAAIERAWDKGWTQTAGGADLCPPCSRDAALRRGAYLTAGLRKPNDGGPSLSEFLRSKGEL